MSLKDSATRAASSFAVPLAEVVTLRDDIDTRITALRAAMSSMTDTARTEGAMNSLTSVRGELSGMISATRAAGKRNGPETAVLDRAAARLLQELAEELDDNAERLRHAIDHPSHGASPLLRQRREGEAQQSEARAARLWHVLVVFMEHTGLGPEDLTAPSERRPRQASELSHYPD